MLSKILARIAAETGVGNLAEILGEGLGASDLQSLLLRVYQARAARIRERELMAASARRLLQPSPISARILNRFDWAAFESARDFEAVDLSPVVPFGMTRTLGKIDQNNVLTTIRNADVTGDPTPALALECARRRKDAKLRGADPVRLCASQRVIRLQPFDVPGYTPHFRLFGLVSAGRDTGSHTFEIEQLREHIRVYLQLCRALNTSGFNLRSPAVEVTDTTVVQQLASAAGVSPEDLRPVIRAHKLGESGRFLAERGALLPEAVQDPAREVDGVGPRHPLSRVKTDVFEPLAADFPEASFCFNLARLEGLGYYSGLCLRISPLAPDGNLYPVVDGGFTDWTARLLQDRKERVLATGIGTEFVCSRYLAAERS